MAEFRLWLNVPLSDRTTAIFFTTPLHFSIFKKVVVIGNDSDIDRKKLAASH